MSKKFAASLAGAVCCACALAQPVKLPVESSDKGTIYIAPNLAPTETATRTEGATLGMERPDGSGVNGGVDTAGPRPTYSVGGSTGGNVSITGGAHSDGQNNTGVKAGVTIRY